MMKKIIFIPLLLLLIPGIFSCSINDDVNEGAEFISASINEEGWQGGAPEVYLDQETDTLTILGSGDEQVVVFKIKFKEVGTYDLSGSQASYYTTVGGDVLTSLYKPAPESDSQLIITDYNSESNIIEGTFSSIMHQEYNNPENDIDLLNITNGKFRGTIVNQP